MIRSGINGVKYVWAFLVDQVIDECFLIFGFNFKINGGLKKTLICEVTLEIIDGRLRLGRVQNYQRISSSHQCISKLDFLVQAFDSGSQFFCSLPQFFIIRKGV